MSWSNNKLFNNRFSPLQCLPLCGFYFACIRPGVCAPAVAAWALFWPPDVCIASSGYLLDPQLGPLMSAPIPLVTIWASGWALWCLHCFLWSPPGPPLGPPDVSTVSSCYSLGLPLGPSHVCTASSGYRLGLRLGPLMSAPFHLVTAWCLHRFLGLQPGPPPI